jgi:poly-gamma-glutamate synthesis protein (capsule biosynthesis protein)
MHKNTWIGIGAIVGALVLLCGYIFFVFAKSPSNTASPQGIAASSGEQIESPTNRVRIMFVGDIMVDRGVENSIKNHFEGDFNHLFDHLEIFNDADTVFGNLEGPATDKGTKKGSIYSFQMNPVILPLLKKHKFDTVSFANNHIGDYGMEAFTDTLKRAKDANILMAGAGMNADEAAEVKIIEKNGLKIGYLAFTDVGPDWMKATDTTPGILLASNPKFKEIITEAKSHVDVLITSFHWGVEYQKHTQRQIDLAHNAIDAGADLVIGAHPHVIQDTEWYKGKFIAYSLGNFIFDQYFSPETLKGMLLDITVSKEGVVSVTKKIMEMSDQYQVVNVRDAKAEDSISQKLQVETCPKANDPKQANLWLLPVSPNQAVSETYIPTSLIPMKNRIDTRGTSVCLTEQTGLALEKMMRAAETDGAKLIMTSGFRPYDVQKDLRATDNVPEQDGTGEVYSSVAEPGHSEHQLGVAVDLKSGTSAELTYAAFKQSKEYTWLVSHAHEYGFVQSFQEGTEKLTGYIEEPWHWRYVGKEYAAIIHTMKLLPVTFLRDKENYIKQFQSSQAGN